MNPTTRISFPLFSDSRMTITAQTLALDEWIDIQTILSVHSWGIAHGKVFIVPVDNEEIQHDTELQMQNSFYDYLNS